MSILLSVLVPTRNRADQLSSLLAILERCKSDRIEFLVSDNSDLPHNRTSANGAIKFFRPTSILNMTDHWNFLASKATGKYLTFVGDDDAVLPGNLEVLVNFLETTNADLVWTPTSGYVWPNGSSPGVFYREKRVSGKLPDLSVSRMKMARMDLKVKLPTPYNSTVFRRELLQLFEQEHESERFFSSRIPDVNAGAKLLFLARTQASFDFTVFVSGASSSSNGVLVRTKPTHPRAMEFNNSSQNPLPSRGGWIPGQVPPFGYITFFEAVQESLIQLGVSQTRSKLLTAFRSVLLSSSPSQQLQISRAMWPQFQKYLTFAYLLGTIRGLKSIRFLNANLGKLGVMFRVLVGISSVVSIRGLALSSTSNLVDYLEESGVLNRQTGLVRRSV